jgi:cell division protein FtsN
MRVRGPERSSILLLGRSTVVIGAVVITLLSFGLGYFWGYKGGDVSQTEKEESTAEQKTHIPPEDKKVLEPTAGNAPIIAPSVKPPEFPQEIKPQKPLEQEKEPPKEQKAVEDRMDKSQQIEIAEGKDAQFENKQPADKDSPEVKTAGTETDKQSGKKLKKKVQPKASQSTKTAKFQSHVSKKRLYAIQVRDFPNKEGAEQLQQSLKAKGIRAYVVSGSESDPYFRVRAGSFKNRKDAELEAEKLQKQTGLQNFVTLK